MRKNRKRDPGRDVDLELIMAAGKLEDEQAALQKLTDFDAQQLADLPTLPDDPDDGLTPIQRIAVGHLITGQTISATALAVGVTRMTIYNWKKNAAFCSAISLGSQEALEAVATRARNLLLKSTRELERALADDSCFSEAMRILSCRKIWDMATSLPRAQEESQASR